MHQARAALCAVIFCGLIRSAAAAFVTGNDLYSWCKDENATYLDGACLGFIEGRWDLAGGLGLICGEKGVTGRQVRDVVFRYLQIKPEIRHQPAASLVLQAVHDAFPCHN